jgi:hypothetical protein
MRVSSLFASLMISVCLTQACSCGSTTTGVPQCVEPLPPGTNSVSCNDCLGSSCSSQAAGPTRPAPLTSLASKAAIAPTESASPAAEA